MKPQKEKKPTIKEQLEALKATKTPPIPIGDKKDENLGSLVSKAKPKLPKSITSPLNGMKGGRPISEASLVARGLKQMVDEAIRQKRIVKITDPRTGKTVTTEEHVLVLILQMLAGEALEKKNIAASKEWLDRALGRPAQPIRNDGEDDKFKIDISRFGSHLDNAYGDGSEE